MTSILQDADGLKLAIDSMQECLKDTDVDVIVGTESRGFIFGVPIAYNLHKPFIPVRKKGKLPCETISESYDLEYGSATIEMHKDSIKPGQKVAVVDDLIATGGTIEAAIHMIEELGGRGCQGGIAYGACWFERGEKLKNYDVASVSVYRKSKTYCIVDRQVELMAEIYTNGKEEEYRTDRKGNLEIVKKQMRQ